VSAIPVIVEKWVPFASDGRVPIAVCETVNPSDISQSEPEMLERVRLGTATRALSSRAALVGEASSAALNAVGVAASPEESRSRWVASSSGPVEVAAVSPSTVTRSPVSTVEGGEIAVRSSSRLEKSKVSKPASPGFTSTQAVW
jgi:hypothetical protein